MRKKLLKTILEKLVPYRDMAEDFIIILDECKEEDQEFIDNLSNEIVKGIRAIKSREKLKKISKEIKKIKREEDAEL
jgi:hypothetical protein